MTYASEMVVRCHHICTKFQAFKFGRKIYIHKYHGDFISSVFFFENKESTYLNCYVQPQWFEFISKFSGTFT
jgi:hypothetical protein